MTPEEKAHIDNLSYQDLLEHWRFAPAGDRWFKGKLGEYWAKRMHELKGPDAAQISKNIGWRD